MSLVVHVKDHGINPENKDNTVALLDLLDEHRKINEKITILFEPKIYRFTSRNARSIEIPLSNHGQANRNLIFDLCGYKHLTIQGNGASFIFSGKTTPFALCNCEDVTINGISIDYTDPSCLQGTVVRRGLFSYVLDMEPEHRCKPGLKGLSLVATDSVEPVTEMAEWNQWEKRRVYRAKPSFLLKGPSFPKKRRPYQGMDPNEISGELYRIFSIYKPKIGNAVVMRAGEKTQPGILIHESSQVNLESIIIRHTKAMAVLCQMSEDISLRGVELAPEQERLRCFSGHDDAFHFSNCRGNILIENCIAQGQMDDGLNVHGTDKLNLIVRGCLFKNNRARAILVTTAGKVLIENNELSPTGAGILIAGDAKTWHESGGVQDVTIRNNTFNNCNTELFQYCKAVISILPELANPKANREFHRNITIEGNHIRTFDAPILFARCTSNITFNSNTIEYKQEYPPFHPNKDYLHFEHCQEVEISGNISEGNPVSRKVSLINSKPKHK